MSATIDLERLASPPNVRGVCAHGPWKYDEVPQSSVHSPDGRWFVEDKDSGYDEGSL